MNELFSPIGDDVATDESPCTWLVDVGMWLGAALPVLCIALGYFGPDITSLIFH